MRLQIGDYEFIYIQETYDKFICASLLQDQVHIINNDDVVNANPFDVTDSDVDEATPQENLVDESENEDDFVDID